MDLTRAAGLDKAQMSRVVASLIARHLVTRDVLSKGGGRGSSLSLTPGGRETYIGLIAAANERDRAFRRVLAPEELAVLEIALDKLAREALRFVRLEETRSEG